MSSTIEETQMRRGINNFHIAATVMGVFGVVVTMAFLLDDSLHRGPGKTVVCRTFIADGCDYLLPEGSDTLTHRADCRNPLHWERVLSDTSWWKNIGTKVDSK